MHPSVNPPPQASLGQNAAQWAELSARSRTLLAAEQSPSGAWPASPTFWPYAYCWFRDGSFIADGASAGGLTEEAVAFHDWCATVLRREEPCVARVERAAQRGETLPDGAYLPARYTLDGSRHADDWWNFQVDGYGTWMWALRRHLRRHGGDPGRWSQAVEVAVRYLVATGRGTCRDWWEEHRDRHHVTTLAGVVAGLRAGVELGGSALSASLRDSARRVADAAAHDIVSRGVSGGRLAKWLAGTDIDASLVSVAALYDVLSLDDTRVRETVAAVERDLTGGPHSGSGTGSGSASGVHRYPGDTFYGGGQWPVLACLLSVHHSRSGDLQRAAQLIEWVDGVADGDRLLPEQVGPRLAPGRLAEWDERWGTSAHPLLWSHGALLTAVEAYELGQARRQSLPMTGGPTSI